MRSIIAHMLTENDRETEKRREDGWDQCIKRLESSKCLEWGLESALE